MEIGFQAWAIAVRPKTLSASVVPIVVGTVLAFSLNQNLDVMLVIWTLLCALCIQVATNLINDAIDFKKGADTIHRKGPQRVTQSGLIPYSKVLSAGFYCLAAALLFGVPLVINGGPILIVILSISVLLAYLYTGGPFPLAYWGLGDIFVFIFFGPIATGATFYLQTGYWSTSSYVAGIQIGLLATALIAVNNLRDHNEDRAANKRTLAVIFGTYFSKIEITLLVFLPFLLGLYWINTQHEMAGYLPVIFLPFAARIIRNIWSIEPNSQYNDILASCALLQLLFALGLCFGLLMGF